MKNAKEIFDINHYLSLVVRNRWFIIIPFCIALVVGIYYSLTLPNVYQATTMIMIEPQRVPTNYVKSIVSTNIESRINNISKQILSRTNLETIMTKFNLFSEPEQTKMFMEDKLNSLRKRIAVQVSKARSGNDAFSISFKGTAPQTVKDITNTLASYFIDENLRFRESQASGTNVFLEEELTNMRGRLEEIEVSLKNYRKKNMGELPEQLDSNLAILARMQEQLIEKQKSLRETRAMFATLQQQATEMPSFQFDDSFMTTDDSLDIEGEGPMDLGLLKEELSKLKLRYTDRHPDVVRLQNTIARLETQIEEEAVSLKEDLAAEPSESEMTSELSELSFVDLQKVQKDEMLRDIRQQETEIAQLVKKIPIYQQRIENTPKREQDLLSLQRDYDNIKNSYDSLVQRKLEAEIAVNMEKKQKGEQFRILDSAKLPEKPISPDVMRLFMISVVGGLGIGCGFVFLLDFLDTTIRKQDDLESVIGIPVLSTIPRIYYAGGKRWIRINQVMTFFSMVIAFTLIAGFALLAIKGVDPTVEYVRQFANL